MIEPNKLHLECSKIIKTKENKKIIKEVTAYFNQRIIGEEEINYGIPKWIQCLCCL